MNTLFANEKLGMPVTEQRLSEIRQEVEAQRLADEQTTARVRQTIYRWRQRVSALWAVAEWKPQHSQELPESTHVLQHHS